MDPSLDYPYPTNWDWTNWSDMLNRNTYYIKIINPLLSVENIWSSLCSEIKKFNVTENASDGSLSARNNGGYRLDNAYYSTFIDNNYTPILLWAKNNWICYIDSSLLNADQSVIDDMGGNYGTYQPAINPTYQFYDEEWEFIKDKKTIENAYYKYVYVQANN